MHLIENCIFCGCSVSLFKNGLYDTRFGVPGAFAIYKCDNCGLVQIGSNLEESELKSLYETYYNFGGSKKNQYTTLRSRFLKSFFYRLWMLIDGDICFHSRRGRGLLLDVGCNEGQGLQIYQQNGFIAEGLELNERAASEAEKAGFRVFTEPLETFKPERQYDIVVLSHVLEHFSNPKQMLLHVNRILQTQGRLWISVPNLRSWQRDLFGRYWINWHIPFHITFLSATTLKALVNSAGFETTQVIYASPSIWTAQSFIAALFAKKAKKNLAQRSPALLVSLMLFSRFCFSPFFWRGNLLGRGDCLAIEARKTRRE